MVNPLAWTMEKGYPRRLPMGKHAGIAVTTASLCSCVYEKETKDERIRVPAQIAVMRWNDDAESLLLDRFLTHLNSTMYVWTAYKLLSFLYSHLNFV